jgi:hypothetical protein
MTTLMKNEKKKSPLLPMTLINRFEKSCGILRGGGGKKNPLLSTTLGKFAQKQLYIYIYKQQ